MWYETLPTFGIIIMCFAVPGYGSYYLNKLVLGNHNRRSLLDDWERRAYQRDVRINGNPYKPVGLEGVPDSPKC